MKTTPKARQNNITIQELTDEVLVYDLKADKAFCLNETSKFIWEMCNGKNSITEITNKLSRHYKKNISEDLVYLAISQFEKDGLLANESGEFSDYFAGMSRREVIRKVGFASVIALPIISSIVAPKAVNAARTSCKETCIKANTNFCASSNTCDTAIFYTSSDGSCTGPTYGSFITRCCDNRSEYYTGVDLCVD